VSVLLIVVLAVLAVLLLVVLVGALGASRRNRAGAEHFSASLTNVDRQLAAALAEDRGWDPPMLDAAARAAFAEHRPGTEVASMELTRIVDEPGTDQDLATFRVVAVGGQVSELTLGRRDGAWYAASLQDQR
jgi:type II secretory pathway pseudopilin PulG